MQAEQKRKADVLLTVEELGKAAQDKARQKLRVQAEKLNQQAEKINILKSELDSARSAALESLETSLRGEQSATQRSALLARRLQSSRLPKN